MSQRCPDKAPREQLPLILHGNVDI